MAVADLKPEELQAIRDFVKKLNGTEMTKEEFVSAFETVMRLVLTAKNKIFAENNLDRQAIQLKIKEWKDAASTDIEKMKGDAIAMLKQQFSEFGSGMDTRMTAVESALQLLQDGRAADAEMLLAQVQASIPTLEDIGKNLPVFAPEIRNALETLQGDERLDMSAIRGLDKVLADAKKNGKDVRLVGGRTGIFVYVGGVKKGIINTIDFVAGSGMSIAYSKVNGRDTITFNASGSGITVATPVEIPDGTIVDFTVASQPKWVVADGTTYYENAGYSYNAGTGKITMDVAPSSFIRVII